MAGSIRRTLVGDYVAIQRPTGLSPAIKWSQRQDDDDLPVYPDPRIAAGETIVSALAVPGLFVVRLGVRVGAFLGHPFAIRIPGRPRKQQQLQAAMSREAALL